MKKILLTALIALSASPAIAQERAVVSSADNAIGSLANDHLKNLVQAMNTRFSQIQTEFEDVKNELSDLKVCNDAGKMYAPSNPSADADGCAGGAGVPVGSIIAWPSDTIPSGWVRMEGQSVSAYPNLQQFFTSVIPDMRDMFIRGASVGRAIGSYEADADQRFTAYFGRTDRYISASGIAYTTSSGKGGFDGSDGDSKYVRLDNARQIRTDDESRPKNRAFVYIIKYE